MSGWKIQRGSYPQSLLDNYGRTIALVTTIAEFTVSAAAGISPICEDLGRHNQHHVSKKASGDAVASTYNDLIVHKSRRSISTTSMSLVLAIKSANPELCRTRCVCFISDHGSLGKAGSRALGDS